MTIAGIDPSAENGSDIFPAHVVDHGTPHPGFDRATAERVVEWTNRANDNATCGERAAWDGDTVVLTAFDDCAPGEDLGVTRHAPDEHGRYWIGSNGWVWEWVNPKWTNADDDARWWESTGCDGLFLLFNTSAHLNDGVPEVQPGEVQAHIAECEACAGNGLTVSVDADDVTATLEGLS
ncbi:hypothetical protein [Amycolatopsis sp. NPDC021455]|uniref:hypothetical protein n=1 Tax=Amycolatopsis sp. NPDC021455 TaxID=3154901 RepID=UPI0033E10D87